MAGAPSLLDGPTVLRSIRRPDSGNEQYYALRAAEAAWEDELTADQRHRILDAIDEDERTRGWIADDPHRRGIAERLRATSPPRSPGPT